MMARRYPKEFHDWMAGYIPGHTSSEISEEALRRFGIDISPSAVKGYKQNHKVKSGTRCGVERGKPTELFPGNVQEFIRENHPGRKITELTALLNDSLGTSYRPEQIRAYVKNRHMSSGVDCRFKLGQESPTKGTHPKVTDAQRVTQFKPGDMPYNYLPVGSVVVKTDGYLWKKYRQTDEGNWQTDWKQLHRLIWEEANGPVPDGHILIFLDGDRMNVNLENLRLVDLATNAILNNSHMRYNNPELTKTASLIAELRVKTKRRSSRSNDK